MYQANLSPGLLLQDFFSQSGLIFKQTEERRWDQRFVAGKVYNPGDSQIKKTKRFFFKKFGQDKLQWNQVCSIQSKKFYIHGGQITIFVCGTTNLGLVRKLAQELKRTLRQDCMIELRCDEKIYCDSKQYESEQAVDKKYCSVVFWVTITVFLAVVLLGSKLLAELFPWSSPTLLPGMPLWESLAVIYWTIRLLMLFFVGI